MTTPLRYGFVGCGSIARAHAAGLRLLTEDGAAELVGAYDPDPAGIDTVAAVTGGSRVRRHGSVDELVNADDVDAVAVITPTRFHGEAIRAAVAAGKPIFTEKPIAPTFGEVRELHDLVTSSGLVHQVGFQNRIIPVYQRLKEIVTSGELGRPMGYVVRGDQYWPTGDIVPGHSDWRSDVAIAGGGALIEHSIHAIDIANWLFGPARRVTATVGSTFGYTVEDRAAVLFDHHSGVSGTLVSIFNGVRGREETRFEVFFEHGAVELTSDFVVGAPEEGLLIHRPDQPSERVDLVALRRDWFARDGIDPDRTVWVYQYLTHRSFVAAVAEGRPSTPTMADALIAHATVEAAYRSAASGAPVELTGDLAP